MPIYDFKCSKCGLKFEQLILKPNGNQIKCISCGSDARKLISPVGIIFKGTGFYVTDTRKSSDTNKEPGEKTEKTEKTEKEPVTV